jgi:hypothetical protein
MQSILGALLTAGYVSAAAADIAGAKPSPDLSAEVQAQLTKSFASAEAIGQRYPQYADAITAGAKQSFLDGADWAYLAGIVAILVGAAIVLLCFPGRAEERRLLEEYEAQDSAAAPSSPPAPAAGPAYPDQREPSHRAAPKSESGQPESA